MKCEFFQKMLYKKKKIVIIFMYPDVFILLKRSEFRNYYHLFLSYII